MSEMAWCPLQGRPCNASCVLLSRNVDRALDYEEGRSDWPIGAHFVGMPVTSGSFRCLMKEFVIKK